MRFRMRVDDGSEVNMLTGISRSPLGWQTPTFRVHDRMAMASTFSDETIAAFGITLRPFFEADIPRIVEACSDPLTQTWLPLPSPYTHESARSYAFDAAAEVLGTGAGIERAIDIDGEFMGVIGLKATDWRAKSTEAGYWLGPWARGCGIMVRALCAITDWALDAQGLGRVQVLVAPDNIASMATAQRAGFVREGILRRAGVTHAGHVDLVSWSRLVDDPRPRID